MDLYFDPGFYSDFHISVNWDKTGIKFSGHIAGCLWSVVKKGIVTYAEVVPEVAQEPNYDAALAAIKSLL